MAGQLRAFYFYLTIYNFQLQNLKQVIPRIHQVVMNSFLLALGPCISLLFTNESLSILGWKIVFSFRTWILSLHPQLVAKSSVEILAVHLREFLSK